MAKKPNATGENTSPESGLPAAADAPVVVAPETTPQHGGSFTRNPDGTLTQTEGHGFAPDSK